MNSYQPLQQKTLLGRNDQFATSDYPVLRNFLVGSLATLWVSHPITVLSLASGRILCAFCVSHGLPNATWTLASTPHHTLTVLSVGAPSRIRTCGLPFRRGTLFHLSYRGIVIIYKLQIPFGLYFQTSIYLFGQILKYVIVIIAYIQFGCQAHVALPVTVITKIDSDAFRHRNFFDSGHTANLLCRALRFKYALVIVLPMPRRL